jgi:hypothetical protein
MDQGNCGTDQNVEASLNARTREYRKNQTVEACSNARRDYVVANHQIRNASICALLYSIVAFLNWASNNNHKIK